MPRQAFEYSNSLLVFQILEALFDKAEDCGFVFLPVH